MEEPIEIKVSGWKARRDAARLKMANGKTQAEKEAIREIRRRHYEAQNSEPSQEAPAVDQDSAGDTETMEMTRDEMIQALRDSGQKVGPNIKDETLAERVEALYAEA